MRILAHVHAAPPLHGAGAEWYLMSVLRYLAEQGHDCLICSRDTPKAYEYRGVRVAPMTDMARRWRWADLGVTHLDMTGQAVMLARQQRKRLIHLVHNHNQLRYHGVEAGPRMLAVFNSRWVREAVAWRGPFTILRPPVFGEDYRVRRGSRITLMNMNEEKGAATFYACASRLRQHGFLAVRGMYGRQVMLTRRNVIHLPNQADAREVYRQTRLLLMPSAYESWGRVAIEAAHSGIPTIAHPTRGLRESLGGAGIFIDRDDTAAWIAEIKRLDDPKAYLAASRASRARAHRLDPADDLARFAKRVSEFMVSR